MTDNWRISSKKRWGSSIEYKVSSYPVKTTILHCTNRLPQKDTIKDMKSNFHMNDWQPIYKHNNIPIIYKYKQIKNKFKNTCFSYFNIRGNWGVYKVCMVPIKYV